VSHNFALLGAAGFVAPRHLKAIADTKNELIAAVDPHDSVGILDRYFPNAAFFTEVERFDRFLEKRRREGESRRVHYVTICSPNYLHDAHVRLALRVGAHALCEKPLVLNPWNLDALEELEHESSRRVYTVLQLRLHPAVQAFRQSLQSSDKKHEVTLTYIAPRGQWYRYSWKGALEKSGGVATNIGVHFFDLLLWLFGSVQKSEMHISDPQRTGGVLELERARVRWFLSIDHADLPSGGPGPYRSMTVDGREVEFTEGFADLHTRVYEDVLAGRGFGIADARPSIELVHRIRTDQVVKPSDSAHPRVLKLLGAA
jgi:UDP-N-acetyl-2-amino-2-deoxyglucuronate dehydrogenase